MAVYGNNIDISVVGNAITQLQAIKAEYESLKHDPGKKIKIDANDQASSKADKVKRKIHEVPTEHNTRFNATGINQLNARLKGTQQGFETIHQGATRLSGALKTVGAVGAAALGGLTAAALQGAKAAVDIQSSYKTTENLIVTGGEKASTAIKRVNEMQRDGKKYSLEYGVSQEKIADAYQDLIKRGHTSAEALGVMKSELQASVASGDDFSDVVRVSSNTIEEFGMKTNNTAKMIKNTKLVVNDLAYASDATATDFKSMGVAMEYVGSSAHQAGVSLRETSATIGILSNNGLEADKAGTSLQQVLQHITKITPQGAKALKSLGMSVSDFQTKSGKLKSIPTIFSQLNKAMDKAGIHGANRLKTMNQIFGTVGGNAANILASNSKQLRELEGQLKKAEQDNYVERLAKKNSQTVKMEMARAKTSIQAVTMQLGTAFMPAIASASEALAKGLTTKEAQKEINALSKAMAKFGETVGTYIADHGKDLWEIAEAIGKIAVALGKGFLDAFSTFFGILTGHPLASAGDTTHRIAQSLTAISKLTPLFRTLGTIFATYFVASKIMATAKAFNELYKGMLMVSTLGGKESMTGTLIGDIANRRAGGAMTKTVAGTATKAAADTAKEGIQIAPYLDERGFKASWSRFAKKLPGLGKLAGEGAGTTMSRGLLSRLSGGMTMMGSIGKGMAGKLGAGISIGLSLIDVARGLTPSFKGDRWTTIGKGAGGLIGGGIGMYFGGPGGAAVGSAIGNVVGGWLGKGAKKGFNFIRDVFHGRITFKGMEKGFQSSLSKMGKWASDTWKKIKAWWNEDPTSSSSKSKTKRSKAPSQKQIRSLGGNHYSKTDIANIKQMNAAVKTYTNTLKTLKSVVKKNDPTKQLRSMSKNLKKLNPTIQKAAKYWKQLGKPIEKAGKAFKVMDKALAAFKGKTNPMDRLDRSVEKLTKTLKRYQFGKLIARQMNIADKSMKGKHSFISQFSSMTKKVEKELRQFSKIFDRDWKDAWQHLDRYPSHGLSQSLHVITNRLEEMQSRERSFTHRFLSSWRSWINDLVSAMQSGFGKLLGIAARAMSGIVSRLNSGITAINAVIGDFGGDKKLSSIHYASGNSMMGYSGHPGGPAVINDGQGKYKQELVWQPSKGWQLFAGLNRMVYLEPGSQVMPGERSHQILAAKGIPHYAGGTLSDDEQDKIAEEFMNNPIKASRDLVLRVTNWRSSTPIVPSFGKATAIGFSRGIANVLKDLLGIIKEPINGDWTPVIKSAARILHFHISAGQIAKLLRQIQTESGGRENITQQISDVNSRNGNPAQGLLQFIPQTFRRWAVAPYTHIMKGFDQLVAAINALNHGGEGGWGNIGNGHGWANGGHILQPQYALVGEDGDEYIINPNKPNAMHLARNLMKDIIRRDPNKVFVAPRVTANNYLPSQPVISNDNNGNESVMVHLVRQVIDSINNIDFHPRVITEDVAQAVSHYQAKSYTMMKGGR